MNTFPLIIVESKLGGKEDVPYELRRRGFVVQSASMRTQSLYTLVTLSKKLIVKLSIQENVPLKSVRKDSLFTSLKLANAGIAIIMRATSIGAKAAWVAHDEVAAAKTTDNICTGSEAELMSLCNYYGPNVALKHGLVLLNRYYLQALALVGLIMVLEYRANSARSMWTPVYAAFLALWGSFHLQRWRQRRSALSFLWGVFCGAEEAERDAEATEKALHAEKAAGSDQLNGILISLAGTVATALLMFLATLLAATAGSGVASYLPCLTRLPLLSLFGRSFSSNVSWMFPYAATCLVLNRMVLSTVCEKLQSYEGKLSKSQAELSMIAKKCLLSFTTFYGVPLYYLLWAQDLPRAQLLVALQIVTYSVLMLPHVQLRTGAATSTVASATASRQEQLRQTGGKAEESLTGSEGSRRADTKGASSPVPPSTPVRTPESRPVAAQGSATESPLAHRTPPPLNGTRNGSKQETSVEGVAANPPPATDNNKQSSSPLPPSPQHTPAPQISGGEVTATPNTEKKKQSSSSSLLGSTLGSTLGYSLDTVGKVTGVPVSGVLTSVGNRAAGLVSGTASAATTAVTQAMTFAGGSRPTTAVSPLSPPETPSQLSQSQSRSQLRAHQAEEARARWEPVLDKELRYPVYEPEEQHLHLTVMYGYVALFSLSCPLVPALVFLVHYLYGASDLQHLRTSRRPPVSKRSTLHAWESVWECMSFFSVGINGLILLCLTAPDTASNAPGFSTTAVLVLNQVLLAAKVGVGYLVDAVPAFIRDEQARARASEYQVNLRQRQESHSVAAQGRAMRSLASPADEEEEGEGVLNSLRSSAGNVLRAPAQWASNITGVGALLNRGSGGAGSYGADQDQSLHSLHDNGAGPNSPGGENRLRPSSRDDAISRLLAEQQSSKFGLDPLGLTVVVVLPAALQYWGISPWLYIPAAVLYLSYLQVQKNRFDRKMAIGIVSDPALIKLVVQELPLWITDSQFQRVEWLNSLLQKLWPQLSAACDPVLKAKLQPTLDEHCPKMLGTITLDRFSLGNISPKIVGVRLFDYTESLVRLDVELRWAGDPSVVVTVGTERVRTPFEVSELRISALARIELLDLQPSLPGFRAVSITFMKRPHVEFSLKVARLDIMNIGPMDYNIAGIVRSQLHQALVESILYPKKVIIPMHSGENVDDFYAMNPVGILYITFMRGTDLKRANVFGSDPYVLARTMQQEVRTAVKYYSLNPEWNETHDFMVYDRESQTVSLEVYDADMVQMETFLGRAHIEVARLPANQKKQITLVLRDAPTGSIVVECEYIPLIGDQTAQQQEEEEESGKVGGGGADDVLYDIPVTQLDSNAVLEDDDEHDDLLDDEEADGDGAGVWSWSEPKTQGGGGSGSGQQRKSEHAGEGGGVSTVERHDGAVGVLQVAGIQLRNLKPQAASLFSGAAVFYVQCSLGQVQKRTKAIEGNEAPVFAESFFFACKHPATEKLQVRVMMEPSKVLGTLKVPVSEVLHSPSGLLTQEYMLQGTGGDMRECFISLKLHWTGAATPAHKH